MTDRRITDLDAARAANQRARTAKFRRLEDEQIAIKAMRYEWLRDQHWSENTLAVVTAPKDAVRLGSYCPSGEQLDAYIDAAMRKA